MKIFKKTCPICGKKMTCCQNSSAPTTGWICTKDCGYMIDDNGARWYKGHKLSPILIRQNRQKINYVIIAALIIGAGYLVSHLIFLSGRLAQKANMACVDAYELSQFENTLEIAQAICVDVQQNQLQEIKNIYNEQLNNCQKDAKHWKGSYFWLKSKQDETIDN